MAHRRGHHHRFRSLRVALAPRNGDSLFQLRDDGALRPDISPLALAIVVLLWLIWKELRKRPL
jgi:hypothetical protein